MEIVKKIEDWLELRTSRERVYVLICAIFVITAVWYVAWESSYQDTRKTQLAERESIENKIVSFRTQNSVMKKTISDKTLIQKRAQLKNQIQQVDKEINAVSSQLVSPALMAEALKNILFHTPGLTLIRLTNDEGVMLKAVDSQKIQDNKIKLYQHNFTIQFSGDYFPVLDYLKKLENSPYKFYTDTIDYKVTQFPHADIILKLHTVSKEKDFIND